MKQAILIIAHKNFDYLERVIASFDADFEFYLHIDKRTKVPKAVYERFMAYPQVKLVVQKYHINWGDMNLLNSTLLLCREALKSKDVEYLHVVSGADYPVQNKAYFKAFFALNRRREFLEYFTLPSPKWTGGGLNRLEYFYPNSFANVRTSKGQKLHNRIMKWQKKLHIKRKIDLDFPLYGGSNWWSLSRECVSYLLDYTRDHPRLLRRLRFTFAPEEMYFHTVIMNSRFAPRVVNNNLRHIVWRYKNGNVPANLDTEDLKPILLSSKVFARKFEFPTASELVEKLHAHIHDPALPALVRQASMDKKALLEYLADYLYSHAAGCPFKGLYHGVAGIALFLFHYARYSGVSRYSDRGHELLCNLLESTESEELPDYAEGIMGIASVIEYLHLYGYLEEDTNEILEELDQKVRQVVETSPAPRLRQLNATFRFDKYIGLRRQNRSPRNKLPESRASQYVIPLSDGVEPDAFKEGYPACLALAQGMGMLHGYAGVGMRLLEEVSGERGGVNLLIN